MKTTVISIAIAAAIMAAGGFWFLNVCEDDWCFIFSWQKTRFVNDFESCARLGFPVQESYPERCTAGGVTYTRDIGNELEKRDLILVTKPRPGDRIASPLVVEGEARGNWFFEASFPVRVLDANGRELGVIPAQALEPWMTTEFVPFRATLLFKTPTTERGTLVFEKDNPSGLPEHDDALRMPIRFGGQPDTSGIPSPTASGETMSVKIFLGNTDRAPNDCAITFPIDRVIPKTTAVARAALEELLRGPTPTERREGYHSGIPTNTKLQSLTIQNGVARADFNHALEPGGGSCAVRAIESQITQTLRQFSTVKTVILSVDGETEGILQP